MNIADELEKIRERMINSVNAAFDHLLQTLQNEETNTDLTREYVYPLTADSNTFIGKKPAAVLFGDERVEVKTWREVYAVIIGRCNENPANHERLMYLRNRTSGKVRSFLSDKSDGMSKAYKIDTDLYGEIHYGSATLIHILVNRILKYTDFDCYSASLVLKARAAK